VFVTALLAGPCFAQKGGSTGTGGGGSSRGGGGTTGGGRVGGSNYPNVYSNPTPIPVMQPPPDIPPLPKPVVVEDARCLPWNVPESRDSAVSVARLKVPSKARNEFLKACDANSKSKFDEAEQHARGAIEKFQDYPAAWVLLGVVLEEQHKRDEAQDACTHAAKVDSKYLPAYLCQAEFSTRNREWEQVLNLSGLALGLNSSGDEYVYYYRAAALYHMHNLADAKKSALQAAEIDVDHTNVLLYFLTAQIYEAEGDKAEAAAQVRQILKHHVDREQENAAKQYLANLESDEQAR
jgi:tetratricopeptide (TPR) repeat protein